MNYKILFLIVLILIISCEYVHDPFRQDSKPIPSTSTTTTTTTTITAIYDFDDLF